MAQENEDADEEEAQGDNQYGGGDGNIDAVEQTERMTDDEEQSTEESEE